MPAHARRRRQKDLLLQRKGRREELLRDAASHGPYLWSDIDVENALLWFGQTPTTTSSSCGEDLDSNDADDDSGEADEDEDDGDDGNEAGMILEEGCEFLRRLLHAPGGASCYARPPTLGEDDDGGRRRRKRRRRDNNGGGRMVLEEEEEEKKKKKSSKNKMTKKTRGRSCRGGSSVLEALEDDNDAVDKGREDVVVEKEEDDDDDNDDVRGGGGSDPPLRSILLGYYTLFVLASATSSSRPLGNDTDDCAGDKKEVDGSVPLSEREIKTATASQGIQNVSSLGGNAASSRLLSDLLPIVSARRGRAHDVRRAYARLVDREGRLGGVGGGGGGGDTTMVGASLFEEYVTRPTTCARLAYSLSVYDRIVNLWGDGTCGDGVVVDAAPRSNAPPALHGFLRKLLSLAATDAKIREVTLLVLLEPYKRSSQAGRRLDDIAHRRRGLRGHRCEEKEAAADTSELTSRWSATLKDAVDLPQLAVRAPSLHDNKGSPLPMLSSASPRRFFSSAKEAQGACSCPPLSTLVDLILRKLSGGGRRAAATANDDETAGAAWWTLPSPLLCAVSHSYPAIALEYVRYWIKMATIGHAELYCIPPVSNLSDDGISNGIGIDSGFCNNNGHKDDEVGELFTRAIRRIIQFRSTSDRLDFLCHHELQSTERVHHDSSAEKGDEDEDAAFKTSLAWRAIHRALE